MTPDRIPQEAVEDFRAEIAKTGIYVDGSTVRRGFHAAYPAIRKEVLAEVREALSSSVGTARFRAAVPPIWRGISTVDLIVGQQAALATLDEAPTDTPSGQPVGEPCRCHDVAIGERIPSSGEMERNACSSCGGLFWDPRRPSERLSTLSEDHQPEAAEDCDYCNGDGGYWVTSGRWVDGKPVVEKRRWVACGRCHGTGKKPVVEVADSDRPLTVTQALAALLVEAYDEEFPENGHLDPESSPMCWSVDVADVIAEDRKLRTALPMLPDRGVSSAADRLRDAIERETIAKPSRDCQTPTTEEVPTDA